MSFNKEVWGNTVWFLFHGLAHKIKEDEFNSVKNDFIFIINTICRNLPCPECSNDASTLLQKINWDTINTKNDIKNLLFNFHNHVNKKLNKPQFNLSDLDEKYDKINVNVLYNNFFIIFNSNSNIPRLMTASFHRQNNIPKIKLSLDNIIKKSEN